jgi:two-component system, sensor histidine kinase and response regulator
VLDSNADNFISLPYDRPYLLSLIGGMLDTPVERPTPEQIKTQFKIQHNDHIFVITADRRKLLEFLLSSFEIAVSRHEELSQTKDQIRSLDQSVEKLESDGGKTSGTFVP